MEKKLDIKTMAEMKSLGISPDILFWVGCAGSFDERAKKVTLEFVKILSHLKINFAVLGTEESCTGDPAKRAGNEFLFQTQAFANIQVLNEYNIKKIVTTCPHCFNTLKNEYPELGGSYEVLHHSQYLQQLIDNGVLKIQGGSFKGKKITFHDPCYLGRANNEYLAPRKIIEQLDAEFVELKRCKANGLCCGAGGGQIFKESEYGKKEINMERAEEVNQSGADFLVVACPFCMTMLTDGAKEMKKNVKLYDLVELLVQANEQEL